MGQRQRIDQTIEAAAAKIPKAWPLYAFVTSNPLAGFENKHFEEAVNEATQLFNIRGFPSPFILRKAWEAGHINPAKLQSLFAYYEINQTPEEHLNILEQKDSENFFDPNPMHQLDCLMAKWLSAFIDEGLAEWWMPARQNGFYQAWKALAPYDRQIPKPDQLKSLPHDPYEAIEQVLAQHEESQWEPMITEQMAALPGWTGMIKYRLEEQNGWQQKYPITLAGMLAVRLSLANHMGYDLTPKVTPSFSPQSTAAERVWLLAWEATYQQNLTANIQQYMSDNGQRHQTADAQLVFCIDTRSEVIRRHIEQTGNYETLGYAGFFGIPMNYRAFHSSLVRKSCPPILSSAYQVTEVTDDAHVNDAAQYNLWNQLRKAYLQLVNTFKNNVPASFGYVEGAGGYYGIGITLRTLLPNFLYRFSKNLKQRMPDPVKFCFPSIKKLSDEQLTHEGAPNLAMEEKVACAKALFDLTGWQHFSQLVVLAGHGSHTTNNPFDSSLDCGACAGSPGRHNARTLALLCNDPEVRKNLAQQGVSIPEETWFVAAEHNTTTDEIELFDAHVPQTHQQALASLKKDLQQAREGASEERAKSMRKRSQDSLKEVTKRSSDWAETRPEWGLAGNAAFIIGPRTLTQNLNLNGRCFLNTYDWQTDPNGEALAAIMQGPMVVTQWINNHYYFASVDNNVFGSGTKVTQNVVGKFGVVQGNGGDLKPGLPLQSLNVDDHRYYHQPLRLTVLIHAPLRNVQTILSNHRDTLGRLFENEWLHLNVMDPEGGNQLLAYPEDFSWEASLEVE